MSLNKRDARFLLVIRALSLYTAAPKIAVDSWIDIFRGGGGFFPGQRRGWAACDGSESL